MGSGELRAMRVGWHACRYLEERPRTGFVVSAFGRGFNVLLDEGADPGFVSIQTPTVPLHPWGVEIGELPIVPPVDCRVHVEVGIVYLDGKPCIALDGAEVCTLRIEPYAPEETARARDRLSLLRERPAVDGPFEERIAAILDRWRATDDDAVLPTLVGLGVGSTPAGDDTLVGVLAGMVALDAIPSWQSLQSAMLKEQTSLPAAQMVLAALDGAFPEPLRDLVDELPNCADERLGDLVNRLMRLGATSGRMMLRGLAAALVRS